jgi:hypothetical protein
MTRILLCTLLALLAADSARAESWMFRRSYYSHNPVTHVRIGRQYATGPIFTRPQGEYVSGSYRHVHSTISVGGQTHDHLNLYESWIQVGAQY